MAHQMDAHRADEIAAAAVILGPATGILGGIAVGGPDLAAITLPVGAVAGAAVAFVVDRWAKQTPKPYYRTRRVV